MNKKVCKTISLLLLLGMLLCSNTLTCVAAKKAKEANTDKTEQQADSLVDYKQDKPKVYVSSCKIVSGEASPGNKFMVKLTLRNSSPKYTVDGLLLSYTNDLKTIHSIYGNSNQAYVGKIEPNEEAEVILTLGLADELRTSLVNLDLKLEYSDGINEVNTNEISVPIQVQTVSELDIQAVSLPEKITTEGKTRVRVTYKNFGSEDLYNITLQIKGDGIVGTEQMSIGTLSAGKVSYVESYVNFRKTGSQKAKVSFTYEDIKGTSHTTNPYDFELTVSEPSEDENQQSQEAAQQAAQQNGATGFGIIQIALLIGIIITFVAVIFIVRRYRK